MTMSEPRYFLPAWWDWMSRWGDCLPCLRFGRRCPSCEIPPGVMALAQLVGGGTAVVSGSMHGNAGIHTARQATAAARQHGSEQVAQQLDFQVQESADKRLTRQADRDIGNTTSDPG